MQLSLPVTFTLEAAFNPLREQMEALNGLT